MGSCFRRLRQDIPSRGSEGCIRHTENEERGLDRPDQHAVMVPQCYLRGSNVLQVSGPQVSIYGASDRLSLVATQRGEIFL